MTMYGYEIRNEYGLGAGELYKMADQDNPEAILEGIAMAGLVGFLKQLGDLAEFAADLFNGLHEEVTNVAIRSENLTLRVQQLEEDLPLIEYSLYNENQSDSASNEGINWHSNLETDMNLVTKEDMSSYVMEFYKESRGPPQLFRLDKFDVSGRGACLKRYTDPSYYKVDLATNGFAPKYLREMKAPKAMILPNSLSIEIARSLKMPHKVTTLEAQIRDEIPIMRVKLKPKQFKGSLLSSIQNIFETDSPNHNKPSKTHLNTNTNTNPNQETMKDSSHKRLMSLGSLIEREPNERDEKSQSSDHHSSSIRNENETESEGNNTDEYISEETPSENENYVDALTTMVESEVDSKQDFTESEIRNSHISTESINILNKMSENIPNNKMVKKAVSMKVSFEERESKPNRKLVKDSFSLSLRHMAKQILDFKDDLTEEEFDMGENRDGFVVNSPNVDYIGDFEKCEDLDENLPSDDEMEMGDLIVNCENEKRETEILEMDVMEKANSREEILNEERDEKKEIEVPDMNVMENLDFGEELNQNGEINRNQESETGETEEIEKLDFGEKMNENEEIIENRESETLETIQITNSDSGEELIINEDTYENKEFETLETIKMENSDLHENETQETNTVQIEKLDNRRELNVRREKDEILESEILETNETEKLGLREELHENEERNEIQNSEILETIDMEKLDHEEELNENEETNVNLESEILENVEIEKFGSSEESSENEDIYESLKSRKLDLNEMKMSDYKFHENVETNEIDEFHSREKLFEIEESNEIQESKILESSEELDLGQNFNKNKEINETEKSDPDFEEELHESVKPNDIPEFENLVSIEKEKSDSGEETQENEILVDNTVIENLKEEEYCDNDISNPRILDSIETRTSDLSEERLDFMEENMAMESDEIMMDYCNTPTKELIMKYELLNVENSFNIEVDLGTQYELPVSENITSPVHKDLVQETKPECLDEKSELIFEDNFSSNNEIMDSSEENKREVTDNAIQESQNQNPMEIPSSDYEITINDMINQELEKSSPIIITNSVNFEDIFSTYGLSIPLPSISTQQNNSTITEQNNNNNNKNNQELLPPLPPLPPVQWRTGKPPPGPLSNLGKLGPVSNLGKSGPVSNLGKLGRPPRPKPSRNFPKMAKNQSDGQLNSRLDEQLNSQEVKDLTNKESEGISEGFDYVPNSEKEISNNSNNELKRGFLKMAKNPLIKGLKSQEAENERISEAIQSLENEIPYKNHNTNNIEIKLEEFSIEDLKFLSELEKNEEKKKSPPIPPPFKYPLFQFKSHDKTMFKKAPKLIQPSNRLITPSMLEEIRTRSFSLKPVLIRKPNMMSQYNRTNLKVAAMLEKAHAIRQAVASSDDSDNDSWSE